MARYRLKSDEEMAWNAVRRAASARVKLEASAWSERRLNDVLPGLQVEFHKMLQTGVLPELAVDYEEWVERTVAAMTTGSLTAGDGDA
jgi:hypothetical protein